MVVVVVAAAAELFLLPARFEVSVAGGTGS